MMDKRMHKLEAAIPDLPTGRRIGNPDAKVGLIGIGSANGMLEDAMGKLQAGGLETKLLQPRTLFPVLPETIEFVSACDRVYVVEHNATGPNRRPPSP